MNGDEQKRRNMEAYNAYLAHIALLPREQQDKIFHIASKLWDVLALPGALHAFALVGAELAVQHDADKLVVPEIIKP